MSSIACQKDYTLVVSSGGGPPHGPVQLDAASVAEINRAAKELGGAGGFTGLLPWDGVGQWIEPQPDAPLNGGISIGVGRSPVLLIQISSVFGGHPFPADSYFAGSSSEVGGPTDVFPTGTWTKDVSFPALFFTGIPIVVTWA